MLLRATTVALVASASAFEGAGRCPPSAGARAATSKLQFDQQPQVNSAAGRAAARAQRAAQQAQARNMPPGQYADGNGNAQVATYSAPPRGGRVYAPPRQQGAYAARPQQQPAAAVQQGGFHAPVQYGAPPAQQAQYGAPPAQQAQYGAPPAQQYSSPPPRQLSTLERSLMSQKQQLSGRVQQTRPNHGSPQQSMDTDNMVSVIDEFVKSDYARQMCEFCNVPPTDRGQIRGMFETIKILGDKIELKLMPSFEQRSEKLIDKLAKHLRQRMPQVSRIQYEGARKTISTKYI